MYYKDCLCPVTLSSQILIWLPLQSGGGFSFIFIFELKREASRGKFSGKKCKYDKNTDMEFVKNFTHPDFQAKSFNSVSASNINNLGIFWL